jgi:hypothetical protein
MSRARARGSRIANGSLRLPESPAQSRPQDLPRAEPMWEYVVVDGRRCARKKSVRAQVQGNDGLLQSRAGMPSNGTSSRSFLFETFLFEDGDKTR